MRLRKRGKPGDGKKKPENGPLRDLERLADLLEEGADKIDRRLAILEVQVSVARREQPA